MISLPGSKTKNEQNNKLSFIENQNCCPICLQEYNLLQIIPMLICFNQHSVCGKCLNQIYKKRKCPVCCEKLISRGDVRKNRLICLMIEEHFRSQGVIFLETKNYTFKGQIKNGKKHGIGEYLTKKGTFIKGQFINGEINGKCQVLTKSGARFQGSAENGRLDGTFVTKYGSQVSGNFDIENLSGPNCRKKYTNGDKYEGYMVNLKAQGYGKLQFVGGNTFEGYFINDYIQGNGEAKIKGEFSISIVDSQIQIKQINQQIIQSENQESESNQNQEQSSESSQF